MNHTGFLPVSERYSSQTYLALGDALKELEAAEEKTESIPGYVGNLRIDDEYHASYVLRAPGGAGRDGYDVELRRDEKGVLWMYSSNGVVGVEMDSIPAISTGRTAPCPAPSSPTATPAGTRQIPPPGRP